MSEETLKKGEEMKVKTEFVQANFDIPTTETVIQDYFCRYNGHSSRIWITQNYFCIQSETLITIPIQSIISLQENKPWIGFGGYTIEADTARYEITFVYHRHESFVLMKHLWEHQPTFVFLPEEELEREEDKLKKIETTNQLIDEKQNQTDGSGGESLLSRMGVPDLIGAGIYSEQKSIGDCQSWEEVDTKSTKAALETLDEIAVIGDESRGKLEDQAGKINEIHQSISDTNYYYRDGSRQLDGIESFVGAVKNAFTPNRWEKGSGLSLDDIHLQVEDYQCLIDLPILLKFKNGNFEEIILRFADKHFFCIRLTTNGEELIKELDFTYELVSCAVMRARPQHMDIRFTDVSKERFRLCSSYSQAICNELALHCKTQALRVIFEPGIKPFQYGYRVLRAQTMAGSRNGAICVKSDGFYSNTSSLLSKDASVEVIQALDQVDKDSDLIKIKVGQIKKLAQVMNSELSRENDQLDTINALADDTHERARKEAHRTRRQTGQ